MKVKKNYSALLFLLCSALITCAPNQSNTALPGNAVIANTDYTTGSLSSIDLDHMTDSNGIFQGATGIVDSDLYVRSYNNLIFVLNNSSNNITLIDPNQGFKVLAQQSIGSTAHPYPHDIAIKGSSAYVSLNGESRIWIINPATLAKTGTIDLSAYSPSGATNPSMDHLWLDTATGYLYVALDRLYYDSAGMATADYSSVLVIDTSTNAIKTEIRLQWTISGITTNALDPCSKFVFASNADWNNGSGHDHIFVQCPSLYNDDWTPKLNGGVVAIDTTTLACETGFLVSEVYLGNAMSDFDYANGQFYVATNGISTSELFSVKPGNGAKLSLYHTASSYCIPFAKVNSTGLLIVGDRTTTKPGVWIFNTANNALANPSIITTGLPPSDIALTE